MINRKHFAALVALAATRRAGTVRLYVAEISEMEFQRLAFRRRRVEPVCRAGHDYRLTC